MSNEISFESNMMSNAKLKPCPFCGSDQVFVVRDYGTKDTVGPPVYFANCKGPGRSYWVCGAKGPRNFESFDQAIIDWNTRGDRDQRD